MNRNDRQKRKLAADGLSAVLLCVFAFYVNRSIQIKGLYMDDLYMWSCYGEQSLLEFAFPIGTSTRFRPVYWLATYLQMAIVGTHISWFVPFNVICNIAAALSIFYMARKLGGMHLTAFLCGVCYLASRFAYYQIGQALGLMETMALFLALWILYLLFRYVNAPHERTAAELLSAGDAVRAAEKAEREKKEDNMLVTVLSLAGIGNEDVQEEVQPKKPLSFRLAASSDWRFAWALFLYFMLVFVHERYLALLPLFYAAFFFRMQREKKPFRRAFAKENKRFLIAPAAVFALVMLIRTLCIGSFVPAGTGGTEVTETFRLTEALRYAISQVLYIFGVNDGPEHLCGLTWADTPASVRLLTKLSAVPLGLICAAFAAALIRDAVSGRRGDAAGSCRLRENIQNALLFLLFIALCIGCSSVTIRVEMRWIYVSYAAALLFCVWMMQAAAVCLGETCPAALPAEKEKNDAKSISFDYAWSAAQKRTEKEMISSEGVRRNAARADVPRRKAFLICFTILFFAYAALSIPCNLFYRQYYPKLYFWPNQLRMNSLAEETCEKYGDDVFGKTIYILKNTYGMSDFYKDTFFKTFDPNKKAEGTQVLFADSAEEIPEEQRLSGGILVLEEVPEENAYRDVTEEVLSGTYIEKEENAD